MQRRAIVGLLLAGLAACGTIKQYEVLAQPVGQQLSTHVGGQVFKLQRTSDLPNAYGKADIFGGKVNRGYVELRYQGLAQDGRPVFRVTEVETVSNETTMSRSGMSTSNVYMNHNRSSTSGIVQTYGPRAGSTDMLPPNTTEFVAPPGQPIRIAGVKVTVLAATETEIAYTLER